MVELSKIYFDVRICTMSCYSLLPCISHSQGINVIHFFSRYNTFFAHTNRILRIKPLFPWSSPHTLPRDFSEEILNGSIWIPLNHLFVHKKKKKKKIPKSSLYWQWFEAEVTVFISTPNFFVLLSYHLFTHMFTRTFHTALIPHIHGLYGFVIVFINLSHLW